MRRYPILLILLLILFLLSAKTISAGGFSLKTVGALDVDGSSYKHFWYTDGSLNFTGSALQNAQITAIVDGQSSTLNADGSGNWSHFASLADGDHNISFSSAGSTISFVLTIGRNIPEDVGAIAKAETPTVGTVSYTVGLFLVGMVLLFLPILIKRASSFKF